MTRLLSDIEKEIEETTERINLYGNSEDFDPSSWSYDSDCGDLLKLQWELDEFKKKRCLKCGELVQGCTTKPYREQYKDGQLVGFICPSCHKGN